MLRYVLLVQLVCILSINANPVDYYGGQLNSYPYSSSPSGGQAELLGLGKLLSGLLASLNGLLGGLPLVGGLLGGGGQGNLLNGLPVVGGLLGGGGQGNLLNGLPLVGGLLGGGGQGNLLNGLPVVGGILGGGGQGNLLNGLTGGQLVPGIL